MNNPLNWREETVRLFKGWRFFIFLTLAFFPWAVIKQVLRENDIILGGIPSSVLLFLLLWLIGIGFALLRAISGRGSGIGAFYQRNQKAVLIGLVLILLVGGLWYYGNKAAQAKWLCLQQIEYSPRGYYVFNGTDRFRTQKEALDFCALKNNHAGDGVGYQPIGG